MNIIVNRFKHTHWAVIFMPLNYRQKSFKIASAMLWISVLLELSACSIFISDEMLAPPLLSPASFGRSVQANQRLNIQNHNILGLLSIDSEIIRLVGLSALGQRLYTMSYDGHSVEAETEIDLTVPAELILAQIQFAFWPVDTLNTVYPSPWHLQSTTCGRQLHYRTSLVLAVDYCSELSSSRQQMDKWGSETKAALQSLSRGSIITIDHVSSKLRLEVETLSVQSHETSP